MGNKNNSGYRRSLKQFYKARGKQIKNKRHVTQNVPEGASGSETTFYGNLEINVPIKTEDPLLTNEDSKLYTNEFPREPEQMEETDKSRLTMDSTRPPLDYTHATKDQLPPTVDIWIAPTNNPLQASTPVPELPEEEVHIKQELDDDIDIDPLEASTSHFSVPALPDEELNDDSDSNQMEASTCHPSVPEQLYENVHIKEEPDENVIIEISLKDEAKSAAQNEVKVPNNAVFSFDRLEYINKLESSLNSMQKALNLKDQQVKQLQMKLCLRNKRIIRLKNTIKELREGNTKH